MFVGNPPGGSATETARQMRNTRVIVTHYGGPDSLQVIDEECPGPKNGEVRVRVLAAGVRQTDLMMREGFHPETPRLPFTPGWDLIGLVDRVGAGVAEVDSGQLVAALSITGAYSEFVCLPQCELVPMPFGLDAAEAPVAQADAASIVSPRPDRLVGFASTEENQDADRRKVFTG
ncbi:alcohol dehydrogenase catalytic domain-containing protein [Cupriavidus pinatubonensis]|uniref:alcohol dehydrogenase catalytic domain-containing protein n=2 Tax=Cupriavidus pinatubonensis TaxID=248026 RepID=UPI001FD3F867|nr:alcohol dehydrogenase catalytic domain-containing protein [Cupriavidus pinatubonensis]